MKKLKKNNQLKILKGGNQIYFVIVNVLAVLE